MTKRAFMTGFFALLPTIMLPQKARKKFYITGLSHTATANDCTIPPIIAYGADRIDALLHCCESGGLTVWTEAEYIEMRRTVGRAFDEICGTKTTPKTPS